MALLSPLLIKVFPGTNLFVSFISFTFVGASVIKFFPISLISLVLVYKNPLESFVNPAVFCKGLIFLTLSELSLLILSLRFDPGLALISGRKDYDDFIND